MEDPLVPQMGRERVIMSLGKAKGSMLGFILPPLAHFSQEISHHLSQLTAERNHEQFVFWLFAGEYSLVPHELMNPFSQC